VEDIAGEATYTVTYTPSYEHAHALSKTTEFDQRLLLLEKALGVSSSSLPKADANGLPRAILPSLDNLQKQVSTLSQASTATLDSITRRVRALTQEADQLARARREAKEAKEALENSGGSSGAVDDADQDAKINALYGTLATIENLTPLLPHLLDRLRSLRAIHADAATASETLSRIEKQQSEMALELKQWHGGLQKVEDAIKQGDTAMAGNMKVIETWVKNLEERLAKLP
jgi:nuclear migration protein JNM1